MQLSGGREYEAIDEIACLDLHVIFTVPVQFLVALTFSLSSHSLRYGKSCMEMSVMHLRLFANPAYTERPFQCLIRFCQTILSGQSGESLTVGTRLVG